MGQPAGAGRRQACALPEQGEQRQAEPEGLGRTREVRTPVAKGAQEGQEDASRHEPFAPALRDGPQAQHDGAADQQQVEQAGRAQRGHAPVLAPVSGHHGLPEQHGGFGVAGIDQFRGQGQPLAGGGGLARDVRVDHLVAVAGHILPVQAEDVGEGGQQQQGQPEGRGIFVGRNAGSLHAHHLTLQVRAVAGIMARACDGRSSGRWQ